MSIVLSNKSVNTFAKHKIYISCSPIFQHSLNISIACYVWFDYIYILNLMNSLQYRLIYYLQVTALLYLNYILGRILILTYTRIKCTMFLQQTAWLADSWLIDVLAGWIDWWMVDRWPMAGWIVSWTPGICSKYETENWPQLILTHLLTFRNNLEILRNNTKTQISYKQDWYKPNI